MRATRRSRVLCALFAALLCCVSVAACKRSASEGAGEQKRRAKAAPEEEPDLPRMVSAHADLPVDKGDLSVIRERGTLRVLVDATEESFLSQQGRSSSRDRILVSAFAERHGLEVEFILVDDFEQLTTLLNDGKGDLIAADLTVTRSRAQQVAFTRPTATGSEFVVGRRGAEDLPRSREQLAGREIHVRAGSSYAETIADIAADLTGGLQVVSVDADPEEMVHEVAIGRRPLTVVDSHLLEAIESYEDRIERLFSVADGRDIAWAVRKENPELLATLNAFLVEKALTKHSRELFTGDLDEIRERGVLRVLTRNNPVTYFLWKGSKFGFDFELAQMAAKELGVRLQMVVVPSREQLIPALLEGRGDVIAASFSITPERQKKVAFTRPYLLVDEMIIQRKDGNPVASLENLAGRKIHVRPSSSYFQTLSSLKEKGSFELVLADEADETETLIAQLSAGEIEFTVADSHILEAELSWRDDVVGAFALPLEAKGEDEEPAKKEIAFAVRPDSVELKAFLDGFVGKTYRGLEYNMARRRYFSNRRVAAQAKERSDRSGQISPYDDIIRKYSAQYGLDWRLMAALAYQESRFDPKARSWVGAQGLFQVMPVTGKSMGFTDLENPEIGAHAGIRYVDWVLKQLDSRIPFHQRVRFALAAYNAGLGHVIDARRIAVEKGWDPNKWFGNVEKAMLLLQQPEYYKRARHGYCRGSEPVKYVSEIQSRYENYIKVMPD